MTPGPFGDRSRRAPSTASVLGKFRDELVEEGFEPDDVRDLVMIACEGEIRNDGLSVVAPQQQQS